MVHASKFMVTRKFKKASNSCLCDVHSHHVNHKAFVQYKRIWEVGSKFSRHCTSSYVEIRNAGGEECSESFDIGSASEKTETATSNSKIRKGVSKECSGSVDPKGKHGKTQDISWCSSSSCLHEVSGVLHIQNSNFDTTELLRNFEEMYWTTHDAQGILSLLD